jgi:polysaccharide export outer membrane protein
MNSCIGYKKTLYFQGEQQSLDPPDLQDTYILKKGDVVQIKISNPDTESKEVLSRDGVLQGNPGSAYFTDYYINDSGYVELPFIGKMKLEGYTLMQVDSFITQKAKEYYSYVTVDVKFASFKFLALGEFIKPGQYFVSNETCTIYEALGIAGDAAPFANKKNVQLIRTLSNGGKKIYHLDLTDYSTFNSDTYFIQPNDIIYIQPQKSKTDKQNVAYISLGVSLFTVLTIIITRF